MTLTQEPQLVAIVVYTPVGTGDAIRQALAEAGAGQLGDYRACSFSTIGTGRFLPMAGANPTIGVVGELAAVEEERIECVCDKTKAAAALKAMLQAHPYEEPAYHVYPVWTLAEL